MSRHTPGVSQVLASHVPCSRHRFSETMGSKQTEPLTLARPLLKLLPPMLFILSSVRLLSAPFSVSFSSLTVSAAGLRGDLGSAGPEASSSLCMSTLLQQTRAVGASYYLVLLQSYFWANTPPGCHSKHDVEALHILCLSMHSQVPCCTPSSLNCAHCRFVSTSFNLSSTVSALTANAPKLASPASPPECKVLLLEAGLTGQQGKRKLSRGSALLQFTTVVARPVASPIRLSLHQFNIAVDQP